LAIAAHAFSVNWFGLVGCIAVSFLWSKVSLNILERLDIKGDRFYMTKECVFPYKLV